MLEKQIGKKSILTLLPLQPGEVLETNADIDELQNDINYKPSTPIEDGISKFAKWFKDYNNIS
ncbi:hypothetical protein [Peribacillus sp. NPDC096540]|uniref:hypothetical protein n=1 Tax=Peribacillus sp. NPDC096540 TaxID=3390612 RepID=UPI003CFBE567